MNPVNNPPHSLAGAVDLAALKRPPEPQRQEGITNVLRQLGLVCVCGNQISRGGIEMIALQEQLVGNPPQAGIKLDRITFCSMQCQAFVQISQVAIEQATYVVVRPISEALWLNTQD